MEDIEIRDRTTGYAERFGHHDIWIGQLDASGRKIFTGDVVELKGHAGDVVGRFVVEYAAREGRFVLRGLTPGANTTRITLLQNVRIVGRRKEDAQ